MPLGIFTASALWMAVPSWVTGSYLGSAQNKVRAAASQCLLPCPIQERVRILPVSERPILGIFIFSLRRGGNGCGSAEFTNLLADDRVLDSLYLGNTVVVCALWDNCDPTDGITCPCLPVETLIGTPIQDTMFGIFLPTIDKGSGPSRLSLGLVKDHCIPLGEYGTLEWRRLPGGWTTVSIMQKRLL